MPDEYPSREIGQLRVEVVSLESDLQLVMEQLSRLPTQRSMAQLALLAILSGAGLGLM